MIISRTPFRISFFGGGTDYPVWYREHGGAVLATSIDKYCYITCRQLLPFFPHKIRISYSHIELINDLNDINHPSVREVLRFHNMHKGIEIHHDGDLPARSGIGSSSSFTVGLLNALYAIQGKMISKEKLAKESIHIEQNMIKENVGSQDQTIVAHGGFNHIQFYQNDTITVTPVIIPKERQELLQKHLMLFFTGFSRNASDIAKKILVKIPKQKKTLKTMHQMVNESISILSSSSRLTAFGKLMHENWKLKKSISSNISNSTLDDIYNLSIRSGATGGKIIGAGGGGFLLLFANPSKQAKIRKVLKNLIYVPFKFEPYGSQIIFYDLDNQAYVLDKTHEKTDGFKQH